MAWKGKVETVLIAHAAETTLATIRINQGAEYMWAEVENSVDKLLAAFSVQYRPHSDAAFHVIGNATSDFTTDIQEPIRGCDEDPTVLAASTTSLLWLSVKGVDAVRFTAQSTASSDTYLNLYWSVR